MLGKENVNHLPSSMPSFTTSLSSLVPSISSSLPPAFTHLSVSTLPLPSVMSSSVPLASSTSSLLFSSSATLPLPSTLSHSLPPLPLTVSSSLPSTPLLSLHCKSASRDGSTQVGRSQECVRATPPTSRGRTARTGKERGTERKRVSRRII